MKLTYSNTDGITTTRFSGLKIGRKLIFGKNLKMFSDFFGVPVSFCFVIRFLLAVNRFWKIIIFTLLKCYTLIFIYSWRTFYPLQNQLRIVIGCPRKFLSNFNIIWDVFLLWKSFNHFNNLAFSLFITKWLINWLLIYIHQ